MTATQELAAAGVPLAAYTVNSPEVAARCFALGVAALFTDRLIAWVRETNSDRPLQPARGGRESIRLRKRPTLQCH